MKDSVLREFGRLGVYFFILYKGVGSIAVAIQCGSCELSVHQKCFENKVLITLNAKLKACSSFQYKLALWSAQISGMGRMDLGTGTESLQVLVEFTVISS
jgi:hypothetical protein